MLSAAGRPTQWEHRLDARWSQSGAEGYTQIGEAFGDRLPPGARLTFLPDEETSGGKELGLVTDRSLAPGKRSFEVAGADFTERGGCPRFREESIVGFLLFNSRWISAL